ncbi:MAG: ABC transporter permease subunit [Gemmataceae bacterium]
MSPRDIAPGEVDVPTGELSILFGAIRAPLKRTRVEAVRMVEVYLAAGIADTFGVLLALLWTAGFLPAFLDPAAASVLLAKPIPRWALLGGKFAGILAVVMLCAAAYLAATYVALGIVTRVWDGRYLVALPILIVHFFAFFSLSAVLAVWTRSAVLAGLGTVLTWLGCWAINSAYATGSGRPTAVAYWLLPKPVDLSALLFQVQQTSGSGAPEHFVGSPEAAIVTSLAMPLVGLVVAARLFHRAEY